MVAHQENASEVVAGFLRDAAPGLFAAVGVVEVARHRRWKDAKPELVVLAGAVVQTVVAAVVDAADVDGAAAAAREVEVVEERPVPQRPRFSVATPVSPSEERGRLARKRWRRKRRR